MQIHLLVLPCSYKSQEFINACPELKQVLEQLNNGFFSPEQPDLFRDIYKTMVFGDRFMLCADFADYMRAQAEVDKAYEVNLVLPSSLPLLPCYFGIFE